MSKSYIEFTAFGVYCGEFVNELVNSSLKIWDVRSDNDIYTVRTSPLNYLSIARNARKFRVKTKVVKRSGVYFTLRKYRYRIGIPFGLIAFFGIIVLMSSFVWNITITGNGHIGNYRILEQLEKSGISPGVRIDEFDANKAELEMSLAVEGLAWVNIERVGSRVYVKVSEVTDIGEETNDTTLDIDTPCNVIAGRSGQLIKADVYRGELLYQVSSGINAGDVIVSGVASDNLNSGGKAIHADAELIVEATENIDFYQPYLTLQKAKNGRSIKNKSLMFLGKRFGRDIRIDINADHVEYSESMIAPKVFGFPLPYRVLKQDYVFSDRIEVTDIPSTAHDKLEQQIRLYESNFLKNAVIIHKGVEYFPDDNGIGCIVRYVFHENVAVKVAIE